MRTAAALTLLIALSSLGASAAPAGNPVAAPGGARAPTAAPPAAVGYRPPVAGTLHVLRDFDPPSTPFGPGHLGVDLALRQNAAVLAAAAGTVTFAGPVAGRGVVVVQHADGIRTEYEPVLPSVRRGAVVAAGTPVGTLHGTHRGCPSSDCLHWGARRGDAYLDPLSLLAPLAPVRLLPW